LDPRDGHPRYAKYTPLFSFDHQYHRAVEDEVIRYEGPFSLMRMDIKSFEFKVPGVRSEGPYVEEPPSPPPLLALEGGGANSKETE